MDGIISSNGFPTQVLWEWHMLRYRSMVILTVAPTDPTLPIFTNPILFKRQCMYYMDKIKFELGNAI